MRLIKISFVTISSSIKGQWWGFWKISKRYKYITLLLMDKKSNNKECKNISMTIIGIKLHLKE
jgi:hypothetical protein